MTQMTQSQPNSMTSAHLDGVIAGYSIEDLTTLAENSSSTAIQPALERLKEKAVLRKCQLDCKYFISTFCKTYDPRFAGTGGKPEQPFVLRPKQEELVDWFFDRVENKENGIIEKSRDMGMSYVICAIYLHQWLFVDGWSGGMGSRKAEYVDRHGVSKTLFYKVRFMLYRLPSYFIPENYNRRLHDNNARLLNPHRESSITGEAGDDIGRGDRQTVYFIDEWATVRNQESVNASLSATSNCIIKGSTPNGMGDLLYQERMSGQYKLFRMYWKDDPSKNQTAIDPDGSVYYPYERWLWSKNTPLVIAQEYEISYTASAKGVLINALHIQAAIDLELDYGYPIRAAMDIAEDAATGDKTVYASRSGGMVTRIQELTGQIEPSDVEALRLAYEDEVTEFYYDATAVGNSVTATIKRHEADHPFSVTGLKNNYNATDRIFEDNTELECKDRFDNLATENWWSLRLRFERTYEYVIEGIEHDHNDLISIPNNSDLIAQLSQPVYRKNSRGKVIVNKYGKGKKSPDYAETLMYLFSYIDRDELEDGYTEGIEVIEGVTENDWDVFI